LYEELAEQERLKHELAIARRIQLASLPQVTPRIEGLEIAGVSIPAMEVGGDYFDYLNGTPSIAALSNSKLARDSADQITIIVGDVSGKGTSAALYMSKIQGILRSLHDFGLSPRELFVRANHLLRQAMERTSFVTSIGARFEPHARRMHLARAGHLPLFYYSAQHGQVEKITPKGLGMGLDDEKLFAAELEEKNLSYDCGDVFLFVTDGITEAQNGNGSEFGEESVSEILSLHSAASAEIIRDHIIAAVKSFAQNAQQHDDLTVVVVKAK
jgi:serine phosphatase RsbU (regulator of sigma subunit)